MESGGIVFCAFRERVQKESRRKKKGFMAFAFEYVVR
jgi:hypothetical protein